MKFTYICLLALALVGCAMAKPSQSVITRPFDLTSEDNSIVIPATISYTRLDNLDLSLCPTCVQLMSNALNYILNAILSGAVMGTCGEVCSYVPGDLEQQVCNLVCDAAGVYAFIEAVQKANLDPIYYCQIIDICPVHDCDGTCVTIDTLEANPASVQSGQTVEVGMSFTVTNQTGAGIFSISACPSDYSEVAYCVAADQLEAGFEPGTYSASINIDTSQDPQPYELEETKYSSFPAGEYDVTGIVCNGYCDSEGGDGHKHSQLLASATTTFQVTN